MSETVIKLDNTSFSYQVDENESVKSLDHISLEIEKGSFVAVLGKNGSGKSTLAKHLNALLTPEEGDVIVHGINTKDAARIWDIRSSCGMVFQNPDNQLVSSVVEDDVAFGPENLGIPSDEIRRRVDDALNAVGMYEHRKKGPHLLSGGQKQRIAIAGVLAMNSDIIVFDEPTAMLDPKGRSEIMDIIEGLHKSGKTIILITHFMEEAVRAQRILVMHKGQVVLDGTPEEVFTKEDVIPNYSIELPFAARLAAKLRAKGMDIPHGIYKDEDLIGYLASVK